MRRSSPRSSALAALIGLLVASTLTGCAGFFDVYPNAEEPADLVGTWEHGDGRLALHEDGTFEMTDMPEWVTTGDSSLSESDATVACSGTWELSVETQNFWLVSADTGCGGGGFATGRSGEMTIAFGIDSGSGDPRCWELVREGSELAPRGYDECLQYN
ncbi:hypothetical protein [Microbacterium croceum]|uniref:hypothetical protein n=1 Tax=Microbacterium croceum TaxID=2851645 RepID=UPI001FFD9DDC|nr:hypothetical protein [Microbacterium croceum]